MFFKNLLKTKSLIKKTKAFKFNGEFSEVDNYDTKTCYNFIVKNGALETGYGFSEPVMPVSVGSSMFREVFVGDDVKCDLWHHSYYDELAGKRKDKLFQSVSNRIPLPRLRYIHEISTLRERCQEILWRKRAQGCQELT